MVFLKYLVEQDWLKDQLTNDEVRIMDCRFYLDDPTKGLTEYMMDHIPDALYFDLEKDLSGPVEEHGGRHPLPNLEELVEKLSAAGIEERTKVIVYDDQNGAMASRLWWLLTYLGHKEVYVLNGSYSNWKMKGYPVTDVISQSERKTFKPKLKKDLLVDVHAVKEKLQNNRTVIIDSRENSRYLGLEEPIDRIAGHIPGAVNHFWKDAIKEDSTWKTNDEQALRFLTIEKDQEIVVYCGSGVTACPNILSLKALGFTNVRLYAGSWSDWITYSDNPIEKIAKK